MGGGEFSAAATLLFGQTALLLGWRPSEFWDSTPAELAAVLAAMVPQETAPPDIHKLMEMFPDAPTGGD